MYTALHSLYRNSDPLKRKLYAIFGGLIAATVLSSFFGPLCAVVMCGAAGIFGVGATVYLLRKNGFDLGVEFGDGGAHPSFGVMAHVPRSLRTFVLQSLTYAAVLGFAGWVFFGDASVLVVDAAELQFDRGVAAAFMVSIVTVLPMALLAIPVARRWTTTPATHVYLGYLLVSWTIGATAGKILAGFLLDMLPVVLGDVPTALIESLPNLVMGLMLFAGWVRYAIVTSWQSRLDAQSRLARQADEGRMLAEAQLALMQAQIEPHFLYNTLASVQYLVRKDPDAADFLLTHLVRYLRHAMPKMRARMSTLGQEFELADAYLQIARMRMAGRLAASVELRQEFHDLEFPPLVVQTLVENALKHGVEPKLGPVVIRVSARVTGEGVVIEVSDNGVGLGRAPTSGSGTGLANIRDRLNSIYGGRARLSIGDNETAGVIARVSVPLDGPAAATLRSL